MKKLFSFRMVMAIAWLLTCGVATTMTSCRAQRTITADGTTVVVSSTAQKGDTVHCSFTLHESYQGRSYKK